MHLRYLVLFGALLLCQLCFGAERDSVVAISKDEFDKGLSLTTKRSIDKSVWKVNGRLSVAKNCEVFIDDSTDRDYHEYNYEGDLDKSHRYKVVRELFYNGNEYFILDTRNNCKLYHLLGKPGLSGDLIINLNESETTDAKLLIEIWKVGVTGISKVRTIDLQNYKGPSKNIYAIELKISDKRKILIRDSKDKYWRVEYVLPMAGN